MAEELNKLFINANKAKIAVAFAKKSGLEKIEHALIEFLERNGEATFLLGLDFHTTDPDILWELFSFSEMGFNLKTYCCSGNHDGIATYHPKMYIFESNNELASYIIGSSNLTSNGLTKNIEANIEILTSVFEEHYSDVVGLFNQLIISERRIIPNKEYIQKYSEVYVESNRGKASSGAKAYKEFKEIERELPVVRITKADLFGWTRLVYDNLPDGDFTTTQMYEFKNDFKKQYPNNSNIGPKIRQQLQLLEKMGLIVRIKRNLWRKK